MKTRFLLLFVLVLCSCSDFSVVGKYENRGIPIRLRDCRNIIDYCQKRRFFGKRICNDFASGITIAFQIDSTFTIKSGLSEYTGIWHQTNQTTIILQFDSIPQEDELMLCRITSGFGFRTDTVKVNPPDKTIVLDDSFYLTKID